MAQTGLSAIHQTGNNPSSGIHGSESERPRLRIVRNPMPRHQVTAEEVKGWKVDHMLAAEFSSLGGNKQFLVSVDEHGYTYVVKDHGKEICKTHKILKALKAYNNL